MAVHDRPAAFEGSDGFSYSVEIMAEETGDAAAPWAASSCSSNGRASARRRPKDISRATISCAAPIGSRRARARSAQLPLDEVKALLDRLIAERAGRRADASLVGRDARRDGRRVTDDRRRARRRLSGTGGIWQVRTESGETVEASLRGRLKKSNSGKRADGSLRRDTMLAAAPTLKLAVGDDVHLEPGDAATLGRSPRFCRGARKLARRAPGGGQGERIVAANVDQVVVMFAAAKPEPHPRMLDRFLVIAEGERARRAHHDQQGRTGRRGGGSRALRRPTSAPAIRSTTRA